MSENQNEEWIDSKDVAKILKTARSTVYNLLHAGAFKTVTLQRAGTSRGRRLVAKASVYAFLEARAVSPHSEGGEKAHASSAS